MLEEQRKATILLQVSFFLDELFTFGALFNRRHVMLALQEHFAGAEEMAQRQVIEINYRLCTTAVRG